MNALERYDYTVNVADSALEVAPHYPTVTFPKEKVIRFNKIFKYLLEFFSTLCEKPAASLRLGDIENMRIGITAARGLDALKALRSDPEKMDGMSALYYSIATGKRILPKRDYDNPFEKERRRSVDVRWNHSNANAESMMFCLRDFINPDGTPVEWVQLPEGSEGQ